MAKQDHFPKHKARIPKSSHNLSHDFGLTCSTGQLLPVFHDLANGGETYELGLNYKIRTQPLAAALMASVDVHADYFFVPLTLLYSHFESSIFQIRNDFSSLFPNNVLQKSAFDMPILNWQWVRNWIVRDFASHPFGSAFDAMGVMYKRLCDCLGFNPNFFDVNTQNVANGNVFPFGLLAYQAAYHYFYRIDDRAEFVSNQFNWDIFNTQQYFASDNTSDQYLYRNLFQLHYRPYYLDYFTSAKCSPITSDTNINGQPDAFELAKSWLSREIMYDDLTAKHSVITNGAVGSSGGAFYPSGTPNIGNASQEAQTQFGFNAVSGSKPVNSTTYSTTGKFNGADINTANLRALFANEKLWSITGRTRKTYDDQLEAHFGFRPPTDVKHQLVHIGHTSSPFEFGAVIQTGGSIEGSPLGEIAGKGYASNQGKKFKFTCPCHGVILTVFSILPKLRYRTQFDKYNQLATWQDFYQPEFDHLGMQPIFGYENMGDGSLGSGSTALASNIIGWQFRYEHFKRRWNKCTDAFTKGVFKTWMLGAYPIHQSQPSNTGIHVDQAAFLCRPTELNDRMMVNYTTNYIYDDTGEDWLDHPELMYSRDPFIVDLNIHCIKVSTMSDFSLPRLD